VIQFVSDLRQVGGFSTGTPVYSNGEVNSIQHSVIKFVSDLRQTGVFLLVSSTNKTDCLDISEILLNVALNTLTLILYRFFIDVDMSFYGHKT
jgi:hypothetical protein